MPIFGAIVSLFSNIFGGMAKLRTEQAEVIKQTTSGVLDMIKNSDTADAAKVQAHIQSLIADSQSESWITRNWRPFTLMAFSLLFILYLFGFAPVNMTPQVLEWIMGILQIGLVGYGGLRTGEKIVSEVMKQVNIGKLAQAFVDKKL